MKFEVVSPIKKDGREYQAGDSIELTKAEAAAMPWAVKVSEADGPQDDQQGGGKQDEKQAKPINRPPWWQKLFGGAPDERQPYMALADFTNNSGLNSIFVPAGDIEMLTEAEADKLGADVVRVLTKKEYEELQSQQQENKKPE